jgi:WD40 repeat protein
MRSVKHVRVFVGCTACLFLVAGMAVLVFQSTAAPSPQLPEVLHGHEGIISSVSFSPDGKWIASGSMDHTVRLWEAASGKPGPVLHGHTDEVYAIAFAPDGRQLASAGNDRKVILWDVPSGVQGRTLSGFPDWSVSIAYSPDGRQLAVGTMDGSVTMYDLTSGGVIRTINPQKLITAVAISPDSRMLATGMIPIVISDMTTGQKVKTLEGAANLISGIVFSPDGRLLAAGSWDKTARIWNVDTGALVQTLKPGMELPRKLSAKPIPAKEKPLVEEMYTLPVTAVAFSPDGKLLASAGADKTVRLWDMSNGKEVRKWVGHEKAVTCVAFSPDGKTVVSGSADKTLRIWPVAPADQ